MKKQLLLLMVALSACTAKSPLSPTYKPKYKAGECGVWLRPEHVERWEKQTASVERVIEVGDSHYHTVRLDDTCAYLISRGDKGLCYSTYTFQTFDDLFSRKSTNCPRIEDFPGYKEGRSE